MFKLIFKIFQVMSFSIFLAACTSVGGIKNTQFGLKDELKDELKNTGAQEGPKLTMVVPVFDPNIPKDMQKANENGIWPELRRTEAVRMALLLSDALSETNSFESVRVSPDTENSASLYTLCKIITSNGEKLGLDVAVFDITGKKIFQKEYSFTVEEYALDDPRKNKNEGLYKKFFDRISHDIASSVNRLSPSKRETISLQEMLKYADFFEPNYSSQFFTTDTFGNVKMSSYPNENDPMLNRIKTLKIKDQMFIDNLQTDYINFYDESNTAYINWQKAALIESKAAREAKTKAVWQGLIGGLALVAGTAMATNNDNNNVAKNVAAATAALAGVVAIKSAMGSSAQAKAHKETLSELGKSMNFEVAPKVMQLEDKQIELKGTAKQQYSTWRAALKQIYQEESTPNTEL